MYEKYNSIKISIIDIDYDMNVCAQGVILPIVYFIYMWMFQVMKLTYS